MLEEQNTTKKINKQDAVSMRSTATDVYSTSVSRTRHNYTCIVWACVNNDLNHAQATVILCDRGTLGSELSPVWWWRRHLTYKSQ